MRLLFTILSSCICLFPSEKSISQPGSLDKTFGMQGKVITDFNKKDDYSLAMALQQDGKIISAGYSINASGGEDMSVCRYLPDGSLDTLFGNKGKVELNFPGFSVEEVHAIALQHKKILLAGIRDNSLVLHRLNENGNADSSFGINGTVFYDTSHYNFLYAVKIQKDNKIVTAGLGEGFKYGVANVFELHRFNADGSIDTTFGNKGDIASHFGDGNDAANDLVIQNNGKIVVGGFTIHTIGQYDYPVVTVARYNTDGTLDSSFGVNGIDTTFINSPYDVGVSLALQDDQKIIASAFSYNGTNNSYGLIRYTANGIRDSTFGTNGIEITKISTANSSSVSYDNPYGVCIDSDGKIYQAGTSSNGSDLDFGLVKYNPNGSLDSSFGNNGKVLTPILTGNDYAESILLQNDSKIIVGGSSQNVTDYDFSMVRYNNENTLPVSFLNFSAQKQNTSSLLQWKTTNEINNSYFNVERSPDSKLFYSIGTKQGLNNAGTNYYSFIDDAPIKGINYYRLKQVDKDGNFTSSQIASVDFINDKTVFAVTPNPANNIINVVIPQNNSVSEIIIYNVEGKKILHEQIAANVTSKQININTLTSGVYNIVLMQNGKKQMIKFIKK